MPSDYNLSICVDSALKAQAEEVLDGVGMTIPDVVNMLLTKIVREHSIPLSLSLYPSNSHYADLLEAQTERLSRSQRARCSGRYAACHRGS